MGHETMLTGRVAELFLQKGARLKLGRRGKEKGILGTQDETYFVDRIVTFTGEEIEVLKELLVDKREGEREVARDLYLVNHVVFVVDASRFKEADPARPARGDFADFSK